jgi:hypothetical protein
MRKILFTIILCFVSISNAHALKFEKCYSKEVTDKEVEEHLIEMDMFGKFNNEKFESNYIQVFSDGTAEKVSIKTDKWHKESSKNIDEEYGDKSYVTLETLARMKQKIRRSNYKVIFANENYITLESTMRLHKKLAKITITLNLKNGEASFTNWEGKLSNIKQCEISKKGKSGLLDYWWALILIIAITFFIYTQSATRLKKLKIRK